MHPDETPTPPNEVSTDLKLHAFIAKHSEHSRRKAEQLILDRHVTVNGKPAHQGQRVNPSTDLVRIDGQILQIQEEIMSFLVNKPVGIVSTTSDELGRRTVLNLLPPQPVRLYPVGRLDKDSQGLMLLTNDGDLTYRLTHPSFEVPKTYVVTVAGNMTDAALGHLERGVKLRDGWAQPDRVEVVSETDATTTLEITLHEGRNQEIRRMLMRVGYEVIKLVRTHLGPYTLEQLGTRRFMKI
jgi:23S rRNA pseudouridine2605 synthase